MERSDPADDLEPPSDPQLEQPDHLPGEPPPVPRFVEEDQDGDEFASLSEDDGFLAAEEDAMHWDNPQ